GRTGSPTRPTISPYPADRTGSGKQSAARPFRSPPSFFRAPFFDHLAQKLGRALRKDRVDVESGSILEPRDPRGARDDLDVPVIMILHPGAPIVVGALRVLGRRVDDQVVGRVG